MILGRFARGFTTESAVFVLLWVGTLIAYRSEAFADPGALWHVRVGEIILDTGTLPSTDPFTFSFAGRPWIPYHWLGEVPMALAYRALGFDGLLLGFATLIAGFYTWLFSRLRSGGLKTPLALAFVAFAYVAAGYHFYARPHLFTLGMVGLTMAWLVDVDRSRAPIARLAWLIPLYVVWTNVHGGTLGGCMMLALAAADWGIRFLTHRESPIRSRLEFAILIAIGLGCGATIFVNPFGLELPRVWFRILQSTAMKEVVSEHEPLHLDHTAGQVVVAFAALYLFVLAGAGLRWPRVTWLIPLVWFALTVRGIRQGPLFAIAATVALADLWPHTVWHRFLLARGEDLVEAPGRPPRRIWFAFAGGLVAVSALLIRFGVALPILGAGCARLDPQSVPVDLNPAIRECVRRVPAGSPIFNDCRWGGYLIFFAPELKIFMDDRFELCGDDWLRNYAEAIVHRPEQIDVWAEGAGCGAAVVCVDSPADRFLSASPRWREAKRGVSAVLFLRNRP